MVMEDLRHAGMGACIGGAFLVMCLFMLPEHVPLLDVQAQVDQMDEKIETRLSAGEYIKQMGPDTPAWNRPIKIKEASAEPR